MQTTAKTVKLVRKGRALAPHLEGQDHAAVLVEDDDFKDESTGQNKDINAAFWAVGTFAASADGADADFNTRTAKQTITATLNQALSPTDKLWGSVDNGNNWTGITSKVSGNSVLSFTVRA